MVQIEQEAIRQTKRMNLAKSTCLSYAWDDRDGHMLLRYRGDVPPNWSAQCRTAWGHTSANDIHEDDARQLCHIRGVVGVGRVYYQKTLQDLSDDAAEQIAQDVIAIIRVFCTPLGAALDQNLFSHMQKAAKCLAVDGALLKAARMLRDRYMRSVVIVCRDASHAIRLACKEPLQRTEGFGEQFGRLFTNKDALLKKVDFSNKLKAQLAECQKYVVEHENGQGGGLISIMRYFSHSPIRWESMAAPQRVYCCILLAVPCLAMPCLALPCLGEKRLVEMPISAHNLTAGRQAWTNVLI